MVKRNDDGTVFVEGLWSSACHPIERGMDIEMPDGLAIIEVARLDAVMRMLVDNGDMTPMAVRQIKRCTEIDRESNK